MPHVDRNLIPGESVAYRTGLHWIVLVPALLAGACFVLAAVAVTVFLGGRAGGDARTPILLLALVLFLIGAGCLVAGIIERNATRFTVTSRRVLIKTGILRRHTTEILLMKVESVSVEESLAARLLGYGRVAVHGTGGTPEAFDRIAAPHEFRRQVQIQIEVLSDRARTAGA